MRPRLLHIFLLLLIPVSPAVNRCVAQITIHRDQELATNDQSHAADAFRLINAAGGTGSLYPDSALQMLDQALAISYRTGYSWGIAKSLQLSGIIYSHTGRSEQGIDRLRQLIYYCLTTGKYTDMLGLGYNILGNIYQAQGKYREAAYYYHQTLRLPKEYIKESTTGLIYVNLARLTHKLKQPRKALYYLDRAEAIASRNKKYDLLSTIHASRGTIYADMAQPDSAKQYLRRAMSLIREHSRLYDSLLKTKDALQDVEYDNLVRLADLWLQEGKPDSARACINRMQEIQVPILPQQRNKAYLTTGRFYLQTGDYIRAEHYLQMALDSVQHAHANNELPGIYMALSDLYHATGRCQKALQHNRYYIRLKDSLESEDITSNVHQLEVRYRISEKDRELISQKLEISRQQSDVREKKLWIAIITSGMIVLVIVSAALYKRRQADRRLQLKEIQILQQRQQAMQQAQEIERLKAMMKGEERERSRLARELHDGIGGMLTAIKMNLSTARRKEPELSASPSLKEIMHMLEDTGSEIRKTAHNLMPDVLVHNTLPEALMIFCTHIHKQLPTDLSCQGDFSQLDKATELMLYRMTQELIQNVLKHASATRASIELIIYEGKLILTVEDNGTGFDTSRENSGFGLQNLRYRVAALQGDISITSDKNRSTIIHVAFELEKLRLG